MKFISLLREVFVPKATACGQHCTSAPYLFATPYPAALEMAGGEAATLQTKHLVLNVNALLSYPTESFCSAILRPLGHLLRSEL